MLAVYAAAASSRVSTLSLPSIRMPAASAGVLPFSAACGWLVTAARTQSSNRRILIILATVTILIPSNSLRSSRSRSPETM